MEITHAEEIRTSHLALRESEEAVEVLRAKWNTAVKLSEDLTHRLTQLEETLTTTLAERALLEQTSKTKVLILSPFRTHLRH